MSNIMVGGIFILYMLISGIESSILDNNLRQCSLSDPNLDLCVTKLLEGFQNTLWYGDYTRDIHPLGPLLVGNASVSLKEHHVNLDLDLINMKLHTLTQLTVKGVKIDISKRNYTINLRLPILSLEGEVRASGALYEYQGIFGFGRFKLNSENDTADIFLKGTAIKYKGIRHLQFMQMITKLNINNFCIVLDMDWGTLLSSTTSKMFNLQQDAFINIITPLIEKRINEDLKPIINQLIAPYPLDSLFTD